MSIAILTLFGLDHNSVLVLTTVLATLATTAAMLAVVAFAWAPYVSPRLAQEFGVGRSVERIDEQPSD